MAQGTVKWFDDYKGFGFISIEGEDKDIFAHFSHINGDDDTRKTILENQSVSFDIETTDKGDIATNITVA